MRLAGAAAAKAGSTEGKGLFEMFEESKESDKVKGDAAAIAMIWCMIGSAKQLQKGLDMLDLSSISGSLAARRLVEYYDEVLAPMVN